MAFAKPPKPHRDRGTIDQTVKHDLPSDKNYHLLDVDVAVNYLVEQSRSTYCIEQSIYNKPIVMCLQREEERD